MTPFGTLYIVSTPIGDPRDMTLRAVEVLKSCDFIVCEEPKPARALLHRLQIEKPLHFLNEHTTGKIEAELIEELLNGKSIALISDCGTPLFADPGELLVKKCIESGISVVPVPGASSLLAALVVSGFSLKSFTFVGFLPREKDLRKQAVVDLRQRKETLVILEAPYRLAQLLGDLVDGIGENRNAIVARDLTLAGERVHRDTLGGLKAYFTEHPFKGEFVVVIEGSRYVGSGGRNVPVRRRGHRN